MNNPLVSIIMSTYNSERFLGLCLKAIKKQTYRNIEIIVVDNFSTDNTRKIVEDIVKREKMRQSHIPISFFSHGPERSAQRNFGAKKARGRYVYFVDSDFVLDKEIIGQCIKEIREGFDAVVVHNSPDIRVSWIAKIRRFEVDMYKYELTYSAARFFNKTVFRNLGGYNEKVIAGEDYDIQNRLNRFSYKTGFIEAEALHLGEPTNLWKHLVKYYYYGNDFINYKKENKSEYKKQLNFLRFVYFKNWRKFISHPLLGTYFIFYHIMKYIAGGIGYLMGKYCSNEQ